MLLSDKSSDYIRKLLGKNKLISYTPNTLTDLDQILEEINEVKKLGWARDNEEHELGIRCIAAPSMTIEDGLSLLSAHLEIKILYLLIDEEIAGYVIKAASDISKRMGYTEG